MAEKTDLFVLLGSNRFFFFFVLIGHRRYEVPHSILYFHFLKSSECCLAYVAFLSLLLFPKCRLSLSFGVSQRPVAFSLFYYYTPTYSLPEVRVILIFSTVQTEGVLHRETQVTGIENPELVCCVVVRL
jgi:hypothetical protein